MKYSLACAVVFAALGMAVPAFASVDEDLKHQQMQVMVPSAEQIKAVKACISDHGITLPTHVQDAPPPILTEEQKMVVRSCENEVAAKMPSKPLSPSSLPKTPPE